MNKKIKKFFLMKENPCADWHIDDLKTVAKDYEITYRQPKTSHVTFKCPNGKGITIPARKPIKPIYIKEFVLMIESLQKERLQ